MTAQGVASEVLIRHGNVKDVIFQVCQEYAADIVVLGSSGRKTGHGKGFGSIAEAILRSMPCTVPTVGSNVKPHPFSEKTRVILFPTDCSKASLAALPAAISFTTQFSANLLLIHICDPYRLRCCFGEETACRDELGRITRSVERQNVKVKQFMQDGRVAENILLFAKEKNADFIMMGVHRGDLENGTRLHGIVSEVVREASCPVLTVARQAKPHIQ